MGRGEDYRFRAYRVYCDGFCWVGGSIFSGNSQSTRPFPNAYPGIDVGPDATNVQISGNRTVEPIAFANPSITQLAPIRIAAAGGAAANTNGNTMG